MKKKDKLLISHLRNNARESLTRLSKKTGIPVSTIYDKLKVYQKSFIRNHTILVDFTKLGYSAKAKIMIKVNKDKRKEVEEHLKRNRFVNSAYKINNGYDFLIEGVFKDVKELHNFVEKLEERFDIEDKQVFFVIDEIVKEKFLSEIV
jgi:DNA-binding Lrp family transcriptional regulator